MKAQAEDSDLNFRIKIGMLFVGLLIGVLVLRLWYLQGIQGSYYRDLSERNITHEIRTIAPRGTVYDRENRQVVTNRPTFNIALMLQDISDLDLVLTRLEEITGHSKELMKKRLAGQKRYRSEPKVVLADVTREELARVMVRSYDLPGVSTEVVPARFYPYGALGTHLFGYTRKISEVEYARLKQQKYRKDDLIGKNGIEKSFERNLRGKDGVVRVMVDVHGRRRGELGIEDAERGDDLYLALDLDLQLAAEAALGKERGAVVALNPQTGEVLALVSSPSFDANLFSGEVTDEKLNKLYVDKGKPFLNRAIAQTYAPGSTFKLVMTLAALAEGKASESTAFNCPGYYMFAGRPYHCHKRSGHGLVDLKTAVTVSCNVFFYNLGQKLGISLIHKYGDMLGFGRLTGIDLPGEKRGVMPSEEYKLRTYGQRWYPGETLSVSIGQGFVNVTPIEMAVAISAIANGGTVYKPMLVKKIVSQRTGKVTMFQPEAVRKLNVPKKIFAKVRSFASEVVNNPRGTGKRARLETVEVGGKTGTAQVASLGHESTSKEAQDHGWFVSFAPVDNPTIVMAIVVENGGHGGVSAAPISKKVMEVYFEKLAAKTEVDSASDNKELPFGIGSG